MPGRHHRMELKCRIVAECNAGATLHGLSRRHDVWRSLIRVRIARSGAGEFNDDIAAAGPLATCEARIAALERLAGYRALELAFVKSVVFCEPSPTSTSIRDRRPYGVSVQMGCALMGAASTPASRSPLSGAPSSCGVRCPAASCTRTAGRWAGSTGRRNTSLQEARMTTGRRTSERSTRRRKCSPGRPPVWQRENCSVWIMPVTVQQWPRMSCGRMRGRSAQGDALRAPATGVRGTGWRKRLDQVGRSRHAVDAMLRCHVGPDREEGAASTVPDPCRAARPRTCRDVRQPSES
jgi:transposase